MCGIAGIIHRKPTNKLGNEMTSMLQSMKHRGPDSTGFALYGAPRADEWIIRFNVAEGEDLRKGLRIHDKIKERRAEVDSRIRSLGGEVVSAEQPTEYSSVYRLRYPGQMRQLADLIEDVEGAEV